MTDKAVYSLGEQLTMKYEYIEAIKPSEEKFGNVLKWIAIIGVSILAIDFLGLVLWAMSGQLPPENGYFLGRISREIVMAIIN